MDDLSLIPDEEFPAQSDKHLEWLGILRVEFERLELTAQGSSDGYLRRYSKRQSRWTRSKVGLIAGGTAVSVLAFFANQFPGAWLVHTETLVGFYVALGSILLTGMQTLDAFRNDSGFAASQFQLYFEYRRIHDCYRARWIAGVEAQWPSKEAYKNARGIIVEFADDLAKVREQAVSADSKARAAASQHSNNAGKS